MSIFKLYAPLYILVSSKNHIVFCEIRECTTTDWLHGIVRDYNPY